MDLKRTVLVVGNGFDLDLGLKTSYKDFFDSDFFPKQNQSKILKDILSSTGKLLGFNPFSVSVFEYLNAYRQITNWCDIEGALSSLLEYYPTQVRTGFFITERSFKELHSKFCEYLNNKVTSCFEQINKDSIAYRLAMGITNMPMLSILNFNYTPTLEYIDSWYRKKVDYIHGSLNDNSIIFGIEDDLDVPKEYSFLLKTFSPHYRSHHIRKQLLDADHIIFFGHSLAKADYHYFKDLFMRQTNPEIVKQNQKITIFTKDESSMRDVLWQIRIMNENRSDYLFDLCNFQIFRTEDDTKRIEAFFTNLTQEKDELKKNLSFFKKKVNTRSVIS